MGDGKAKWECLASLGKDEASLICISNWLHGDHCRAEISDPHGRMRQDVVPKAIV